MHEGINDLVSVIMPNYCCPYLLQAIDSVLMQDYPYIQLIVTDDCSTQWNQKTIEDYLYKNGQHLHQWRVLSSEKNNGTVKNINRALELASGEYVFFLASDDTFFDETVISEWVAEFRKTGADVITGKRMCFDSENQNNVGLRPTGYQIRWIQTLSCPELYEKLARENFIFGCCTARTMSCIRKYGYCDESYSLIDDYPQILFLLRNNVKIHFFDRTVVYYRLNGVSSPIRYNEKYEKDAERILYNEIVPNSRHPRIAEWYFNVWKRHHILSGYCQELNRHLRNKSAIFLCIKVCSLMIQPSYLLIKFETLINQLRYMNDK